VRRRKPLLAQENSSHSPICTSPEPNIEDNPKNPAARRLSTDIAKQFARNVGNYLIIAYIFVVAPPFVHDEAAEWNDERLENRLNSFQGWVWGANAALFA
jgi:hypothetical protein